VALAAFEVGDRGGRGLHPGEIRGTLAVCRTLRGDHLRVDRLPGGSPGEDPPLDRTAIAEDPEHCEWAGERGREHEPGHHHWPRALEIRRRPCRAAR